MLCNTLSVLEIRHLLQYFKFNYLTSFVKINYLLKKINGSHIILPFPTIISFRLPNYIIIGKLIHCRLSINTGFFMLTSFSAQISCVLPNYYYTASWFICSANGPSKILILSNALEKAGALMSLIGVFGLIVVTFLRSVNVMTWP